MVTDDLSSVERAIQGFLEVDRDICATLERAIGMIDSARAALEAIDDPNARAAHSSACAARDHVSNVVYGSLGDYERTANELSARIREPL